MPPLLFSALPDLARSAPWLSLAETPTAVEPCTALYSWLGRGNIFMKRDDQISSLYGGNKVRRYEYLLADARAKGAKHLVTAGGIASTQMMATAIFGKALGFEVHGVLYGQPVTNFARESILGFVEAGADLTWGGNYVLAAFRTLALLRRYSDSYLILPGAGTALANLGYVDAMLELAQQVERGEAKRPDVIVLPAGSSGTLAAIALGAAWLGWNTEVIGVRITTPLGCNRITVDWAIGNTDRFIEERDARWKPQRHRVNYSIYGGALGRGYGYPTPQAIDGISRIDELVCAPGEVTYTGKTVAALKTIATSDAYRDKTILLWNTLSSKRPIVLFSRNGAVDHRLMSDGGRVYPRPPAGMS